MFNSNPQFRDMMQNPEFIRQLFSPGMMQVNNSPTHFLYMGHPFLVNLVNMKITRIFFLKNLEDC